MCLTQKQCFIQHDYFQKYYIKKLLTSESQPILPQPGIIKLTNPVTN